MHEWLSTAMRRDVVLRALKVAGIVGSILVGINQGDLILSGQLSADTCLKIALTYLVPYCVATYAAVSAIRSNN